MDGHIFNVRCHCTFLYNIPFVNIVIYCRMSEVIRLCTNNIPNNATATYHMLLKKLTRHNETYKTPSKTKGKTSPDSRLSTPNNSKVSNVCFLTN